MPSIRSSSWARLRRTATWTVRIGLALLPLIVVATGFGGAVLRVMAAAIGIAAWVSFPLFWGRSLIVPSAPIRRRDFNTIK